MHASISIEPSDFVLPSGPKIVVVRIDRDALPHLDPSMDPFTDADRASHTFRKAKVALEQARFGLSTKLFGADFPCLNSSTTWPQQPSAPVVPGTIPPSNAKYVGFYFKHGVGAEDLRPPVFDLTSEGDLVNDCVCFHAREVGEDRKNVVLGNVALIEEGLKEMAAEKLQAAQ